MKLLFLKAYHRWQMARDIRRKARLMDLWERDRERLDNEYRRELRFLDQVISDHGAKLTEVESERLWKLASERSR